MSDTALRELERKWKASGAPEDHAALINGRVRAGELEVGRVVLASHLGSPGAALVCPPPPVPRSQSVDLPMMGLSDKLSPFGGWANLIATDERAAVRTAISAISFVLPRLMVADAEAGATPPSPEGYGGLRVVAIPNPAMPGVGTRTMAMIVAATSLALDWTEANRIRAISCSLNATGPRRRQRQAGSGFSDLSWLSALGHGGLTDPPGPGWLEEICYGSVLWRGNGMWEPCEEHAQGGALDRAGYSPGEWIGLRAGPSFEPCWKCLIRDVQAVQAKVAEDVVPWLLGDGDPLAAALEAAS